MAINLSHAKKGQKYMTQDGREAVYIGRDSKLERPYIFRVDDYVVTRLKNGIHCKTCSGSVYPAIIGRKK